MTFNIHDIISKIGLRHRTSTLRYKTPDETHVFIKIHSKVETRRHPAFIHVNYRLYCKNV